VDEQIAVGAEDNRVGIFASKLDAVIICFTRHDPERKVDILQEMVESLLADDDDERRWEAFTGLSKGISKVIVQQTFISRCSLWALPLWEATIE
jgi:hypothetical protein